MIFERHANLKYKFGNRHFWCRGYYVDTVGKNTKKIQEYIQNQLKEDYEYDQMTLRLANHFDESLDFSAGKKPLEGVNKPPAKPVVLIKTFCQNEKLNHLIKNRQ